MAFSNVRSLITRLGVLLDHDPNNVDVREARLDAINRRYLDTSELFDWLPLQIETDWNVWEDRTGTSTGFTVAVTNGLCLITFSSSLGATFIDEAEGCEFEDDGGRVYRINRFSGVTTAYLNDAYSGSTAPALATWTLRLRRFLLPADCARPLGYIDRVNGGGRLVQLDRRREEMHLSRQSETTGSTRWMVEDDNDWDRAPDPTLAVTDDTASGSLVASSIYEWCYTFVSQGRESPPCPPYRLTLSSAASHRGLLTGIENTQISGVASGILKKVYRRQITKGASTNIYSRWFLVTTLNESDTTYTDTGSVTAVLSNATDLRYTAGRKWMRPKWIPSEDATLRLRYLRRPRRLVADSDYPWWPEAYHDLLLYGAAVDLAMQYGLETKADRWQATYDAMLKRMKSAHLAVPDVPSRREQMDMGGGGGAPYRAGTASGDFTG